MINMIKVLSIALLFISSGLSGQTTGEKSMVRLNVDWPTFMARHDLVWDKMPADYFEGAFAGNGLLGTRKIQTCCIKQFIKGIFGK